jgi:hypothetical protein
LERDQLIGENGVILFKGVMNNEPEKYAKGAGKEKGSTESEKQDELRCDGTRFSSV